MITNKEQYKNAVKGYKVLLKTIEKWKEKAEKNPEKISIKMQYDAFKGQLPEIEKEIKEYKDLTSGNIISITTDSINELPEAIVKYRIMNKVSYKELAKKIGVSEKEIRDWEIGFAANSYRKASLERVIQILDALDGKITIRFEKDNSLDDKVK